jgi:two-component system chemotaxis response regulator CheY
MRFLVVDDSSTMRRIIINTLNKLGYTDCQDLDAMTASPVDVVITDWNMPEMNGLEFARAVRANDATKTVPILMVSTNAAESDIVAALKAGVSNYVVKPFTPTTIKDKIEAVMKA